MKWILLTVSSLALVPGICDARSNCDNVDCDSIKSEIREIQAKMRSGYTRAQGERYEARLRKLRKKRSRHCR